MIRRLTVLAIAMAALPGVEVQAGEPDLVMFNGRIITVDDQFSIAQAVAIDGSRIVAVGANDAVRGLAGATTRFVDLQGRTVIPGLIDNHNHFIRGTEYWTNEARLEGVTDRKELLETLRTKAKTLPKGAWLFTLGGWYEDQLLGDRRDLTLAELDAAAPDRPAFIQAKYDHAFVNTAWLRAMNIPVRLEKRAAGAAKSEAPRTLADDVVRDANGRATGRLDGGIMMVNRAIQKFPAVSEEAQVASIKAAMAYYNRIGLTAIYDAGGMGIQDASYARVERLSDSGELTLRVMYTLGADSIHGTPEDARRFITKLATTKPFQGNEWFDRIGLGEIFHAPFHWDDLVKPSEPSPADIATAREILTAAAAGGWSVQTHAVQPSTMDQLFKLMDEVNKTHPLRGLRWSITHADNVGAAQIEQARRLGMNLQLRSQRVLGNVEAVIAEHGRDAVQYLPRLRLVQDSGITYGLGTDGTKAAQINPFVTLWWAVTGKMLNGERITREVLTREEALIAHTRANALMMFQEANFGAIKPGLLADMLVIDRDYLTVPADEIRQIVPLATMVGGKVVHGKL
jgi:predicted amidohydrolase YtcJ